MENSNPCSVIIVGAGISGIAAAKVLSENGVGDVLILEAADRIGGRIRKERFGGVTVELGAGWVAGVGGKQSNPVWELSRQSNLRTCFSDYSNARYNIYDNSGKIFPSGVAAQSYQKAVESAIQKLRKQESNPDADASVLAETPSAPKTPIELAIDFILHDFEMAEVEPISTYVDFGEREFLVADERGYEHLLYKMAESFLFTSEEGEILDTRLKLNKVVRELQHSRNGVLVKTEDGCVYEANYVILSVSIGVLQSHLISFSPPLPTLLKPHTRKGNCVRFVERWKTEAISNCDIMVYTKVFLKFPYRFWPCGPGKEFFIYAHERRGYYTFWQHMENAYPGSNILVVTLTNGESKRIEAQSDQETLREAMEVLRNMFGHKIPEATDVLVPRWWNNRFQRGSYSNYPIYGNHQLVDGIKAPVGRIFFTGEHTSEKFSGYVHGGYLSGVGLYKVYDPLIRENCNLGPHTKTTNVATEIADSVAMPHQQFRKKSTICTKVESIDTSKALLEEMRAEKMENQSFLIEPLIALSGSLSLGQPDAVSNLHKFDIPRQLFLHTSNLGAPEAIL